MTDVGEDSRDTVSEDVEAATPSKSKQADPDAPSPASTGTSEPSEEVELDPEETHLPYASDPTPGAVTSMTPKTTAAMAKKESMEVIPTGSWVKLAGTDRVVDQGGHEGMIAFIDDSPKRLCTDLDCEISPREHYHQHPDIAMTVVTRDEKRQTLLLFPEDFLQTESSGRHAVLPHG